MLHEDTINGSPLYMSPILKKAYIYKLDEIIHDPFKSDIYSLGLMLLYVFLKKIGKNQQEIKTILKDPKLAYKIAEENNVNQYILFKPNQTFIHFDPKLFIL